MTQLLNKNLTVMAILVAGVLIAGAFIYVNQGFGGLSAQAAAEKSINFINYTLQDQGVTASLIDVFDEGEVFRIHLKIADVEYDSYMTKSGKFLFPSGFNLEEISQQEPEAEPAALESFAQCLTESGAKFYGAFWCGVCQQQKDLFGQAAASLPYIECSDEDRSMFSVCQEAGISGYPTWEFNGELSSGYKSFEQLAEFSGCPLE